MAVVTTRKTVGSLLLLLAMFLAGCGKNERIEKLTAYLQEERRLREKQLAPTILKDSLESLKQEYGIDIDAEWPRFGRNPSEWITLLRKLSRG